MVFSLIKNMFSSEKDDLSRILKKAIYDEDYRMHFYMELLQHNVVFINIPPVRAGGGQPEVGEEVFNIKYTYDQDDVPYIAMFTSPQVAAQYVEQNEEMVAITGLDFLRSVQDQHVVLNPGERYCKEFTPEEIIALVKLVDESSQEKGNVECYAPGDMQLILPAELPGELIAQMKEFFRCLPAIKTAYFAYVETENGMTQEAHPLIILEILPGEEKVIYDVVEYSKVFHDKGMHVDYAILDEEQNGIYRYCQQVRPFYEA